MSRQRTVGSLGDPVAPVPWGQCQAAGLLKTFCCVGLSACSICRGTIGASPGLNLSAQSAAAPCNIYTGCLRGPGPAQYSHHSCAIVWSDVCIKELQASVPSASADGLCNNRGKSFPRWWVTKTYGIYMQLSFNKLTSITDKIKLVYFLQVYFILIFRLGYFSFI